MTQVERIKQRIEEMLEGTNMCGYLTKASRRVALNEVLDFINEYIEEPSKDLEKAAGEYAVDNASYYHQDDDKAISTDADKLKDAFIAGTQWQKEQLEEPASKELEEAAEERYPVIPEEKATTNVLKYANVRQMCKRSGFKAGAQWKEQRVIAKTAHWFRKWMTLYGINLTHREEYMNEFYKAMEDKV